MSAPENARSSFPPAVLRIGDVPQVDRGNGARTAPFVTHALGATSFLNGVTSFDPGAAIGHHIHNCVESVMVLEGAAVVDIDGAETHLARFDATFVPANVPHHFRNPSGTEPMRIFWTYASPDATRTLVATGASARIDAEQRTTRTTGGGGRGTVVAIIDLDVRPGAEADFEAAVAAAAPLFQRARGCRTLDLVRTAGAARYHLVIEWSSLEDHTVAFRESDEFRQWRALVSPHLDSPPRAEHVRHVAKFF